jgi:hypothetical protein
MPRYLAGAISAVVIYTKTEAYSPFQMVFSASLDDLDHLLAIKTTSHRTKHIYIEHSRCPYDSGCTRSASSVHADTITSLCLSSAEFNKTQYSLNFTASLSSKQMKPCANEVTGLIS